MGIAIYAVTQGPPWPCRVVLDLMCDSGNDHGNFTGRYIYSGNGFLNDVAISDGWKMTYVDSRPVWLCPMCSGKK